MFSNRQLGALGLKGVKQHWLGCGAGNRSLFASEALGWERAGSRQHNASQVLSGKWLYVRETDAN